MLGPARQGTRNAFRASASKGSLPGARSACPRHAARGPGCRRVQASRSARMTAAKSDPARYFGREVRRARPAAKMTLAAVRTGGRLQPRPDLPHRARRTAAHRDVRQDVQQGLPRARRLVQRFYQEKPAMGRYPAVVPELDRARAARINPAGMAAVLAVRAAANRAVRARPAQDVPRRHRRSRWPSVSPRGWHARRS